MSILEKEKQMKVKLSRRKKMINTRAGINENKNLGFIFKKVNKIDKPLCRLN